MWLWAAPCPFQAFLCQWLSRVNKDSTARENTTVLGREHNKGALSHYSVNGYLPVKESDCRRGQTKEAGCLGSHPLAWGWRLWVGALQACLAPGPHRWVGPQDQDQVGPGTSQHLGGHSLPASLFGEISSPEVCLTRALQQCPSAGQTWQPQSSLDPPVTPSTREGGALAVPALSTHRPLRPQARQPLGGPWVPSPPAPGPAVQPGELSFPAPDGDAMHAGLRQPGTFFPL